MVLSVRGLPSILLAGLFLAFAQLAFAAEPQLRGIRSDEASGTSAAVVVDAELPLAHTAQLWPVDERGRIVGADRADVQAEALLDRLESTLREVRAELEGLVRLHVYAARADLLPAFRAAFARRAAGKARAAVTFAVGALAKSEALLALDAVAVAAPGPPTAASRRNVPTIVPRFGSRAAVLPAGPRVFVSGQADPGADLAQATRRTLEGLAATLKYVGLDRSRVVQVKAFFQPMGASADVEREVAAFFGAGGAPPLVLVEWRASQPIEIELIAAGVAREGHGAVAYLTPPGLKPSPLFSRVARVNSGPLIYVSGLFGPTASSGAKQVEGIFDTLRNILAEAGGDFRHLVKATYYVADEDASRALNELRPRYFDPSRPPAASKIAVTGVGSEGRSITVDMIAAPSTETGEGSPEYGRGLKPEEAQAGWISLFDGSTDFGWIGARVKDGRLGGGQTTTKFGPCAVRGIIEQGGSITVGGKDYRVNSGSWSLPMTDGHGPIRLGEGVAIRALVVRPLGLTSTFPRANLGGWERVEHPRRTPERRTDWQVVDGTLRVTGGPGCLEYRGGRFGDLVLQVNARTRARYANGGLFFRSQPGLFLMGYEAQIYNRCEGGDPSRPSLYATGAIDDRQNARRLVSRDFQPFTLTVIARGPHLATWVNGYQVTDWTDDRRPDDNPRQGRRSEPGAIQLQAHDAGTDIEFRDIRVGDLGPRSSGGS